VKLHQSEGRGNAQLAVSGSHPYDCAEDFNRPDIAFELNAKPPSISEGKAALIGARIDEPEGYDGAPVVPQNQAK